MVTHAMFKNLSALAYAVLLSTAMVAATATPGAAIEHWPGNGKRYDEYLGKPLGAPLDETAVATGKMGTYKLIRLFTTDNRPTKEIKVVPLVKLPAGAFTYYDSNLRDWMLYLPTTYAIPRTHLFYNLIDKDGRWSRTGHVVEVLAAPEAPKPPAQDPPAQPNRGPVVEFPGASFTVGEENEIMVTIADPEHDSLGNAYLRAPKGFRMEHMDDINWKLIITPDAQPGLHPIGIQGEDARGKRGEEVTVIIEMLRQGEKPKYYPGPGAGMPTTPQRTPAGDAPAGGAGFRSAPPANAPTAPAAPATPTVPPAPAPPVPAEGPVVTFAGGTYRNNKEQVIPFTVSDPTGNGIATLYWREIDGFSLRYVDGDKWELVIAKGTAPKAYTLYLQGEDVNGKTGKEISATVTVTK